MLKSTQRLLTGVCQILLFTMSSPASSAADATREFRLVAIDVDSGALGNDGNEPRTVFSREVFVPGADGLELLFDAVQLQGDSYLHIWSARDPAGQFVRRESIEADVNSSFTFAGDRLIIDLIAAPGTEANVVSIRQVAVVSGMASQDEEPAESKSPSRKVVCSRVDGRVSNKDRAGDDVDKAVGRLVMNNQNLTTGNVIQPACTGSLVSCSEFGQRDVQVFLSANHCFDPLAGHRLLGARVQFNPPLSTAACVRQDPPAERQFTVHMPTVRRGRTPAPPTGPFRGQDTDWAVFRTIRNANTNRTAFENQGAAHQIDPAGAAFNDITVTGYGTDGGDPAAAPARNRHCNNCSPTNAFGDSTLNDTQQTATGRTYTLFLDQNIFYGTHTCSGNSGSLLLQPRGNPAVPRVVGVHTGARASTVSGDVCNADDTANNAGTNIAFVPFRNAIRTVCNLCDQDDNKRVDNADLTALRNALGTAADNTTARLDADGDGRITVLDLRVCSLQCTSADCQ